MSAGLLVWLCCVAGMAALALAMERHARQVWEGGLALRTRRMLRAVGWLLLATALLVAAWQWHVGVGTVAWLGWLSVAGLALVFLLPQFSRERGREVRRSQLHRSRREPLAGNAPVPVRSSAGRRALLAAVVLIMPLAIVAWRLAITPAAPLGREDALRGNVGPWEFVFAERDRKAPHIEALDVPLKEFVIRFCDSCDDQIGMAYLKLRKPRSLRAAGNAFEGTRDRSATISIPPAVKLEDGLWLTVVGKDGQMHHLRLDLERVSPATARFIRDRS